MSVISIPQINHILNGFKTGHLLAYHAATNTFEALKRSQKGENTDLKKVAKVAQKYLVAHAKNLKTDTANSLEEILDKRISRLRGRLTGLRGFFVGTASKETIHTRIEQLEKIQGTITKAFGPSHTAARLAIGFKKGNTLFYDAEEKTFRVRPAAKAENKETWEAKMTAVTKLLQEPSHRGQFLTDDLEKLATSVQERKHTLRGRTKGFSSLFLSKSRTEAINKRVADLRKIHRLCISLIINLPELPAHAAPRQKTTPISGGTPAPVNGGTQPALGPQSSPIKTPGTQTSTPSGPKPTTLQTQGTPSTGVPTSTSTPKTPVSQTGGGVDNTSSFTLPSFTGGNGAPPPPPAPPPGIFDFKPKIPPPPKSLGDIKLPEGALNKDPFTSDNGNSQFATAINGLNIRIQKLEAHLKTCKKYKDDLKTHTEDLKTSKQRLEENNNKKARLKKGLQNDEVIWLSDKSDRTRAVPIRGAFIVCSQAKITKFNIGQPDSNHMLKSQSYEMLIKAAKMNIKKHQTLAKKLPGKIEAEQKWLREASKTYNKITFPVAKLDVLLQNFKKERERWTRFQRLKLNKAKQKRPVAKKKKTSVNQAKRKPRLARSPSKTGLNAGHVQGLKKSASKGKSEKDRIATLGGVLDKFDIDIQLTKLKNEEEKQAKNG